VVLVHQEEFSTVDRDNFNGVREGEFDEGFVLSNVVARSKDEHLVTERDLGAVAYSFWDLIVVNDSVSYLFGSHDEGRLGHESAKSLMGFLIFGYSVGEESTVILMFGRVVLYIDHLIGGKEIK